MTVLFPDLFGTYTTRPRSCSKTSHTLRILNTSNYVILNNIFITPSFYKDLLTYSWTFRCTYHKNFYNFNILYKINLAPDTINKVHKIITNKYLPNNTKKNDCRETSLPRFCTVSLGKLLPTFRQDVPTSYSRLCMNKWAHKPEDKRDVFSRHRTKIIQPN
jgi:hypothetical protein